MEHKTLWLGEASACCSPNCQIIAVQTVELCPMNWAIRVNTSNELYGAILFQLFIFVFHFQKVNCSSCCFGKCFNNALWNKKHDMNFNSGWLILSICSVPEGGCSARVVTVSPGPLIRVEGQPVSIRCDVKEYGGPREQVSAPPLHHVISLWHHSESEEAGDTEVEKIYCFSCIDSLLSLDLTLGIPM